MIARDPFDSRSPFEALERSRRERLLLAISNGAIPALGPVVLVFGLMLISNPSWQIALVFTITILMIPMSLLAHRLAKRGKADRGSYILLPYFLLVVGTNGSLIEGLLPAVAPAYGVIIVMAGMLLGTRGSYAIAALATALWIAAFGGAAAGLLPPAPMPASLLTTGLLVIVGFSFLFTAFMSQLATRDLRRALNDATYDLVQINRQLEKASRLKSQFTARTSHELRTPLSAIIVFTDLALRKAYGPLTPKQEDSLRRVLQSAKRLQALIEDILDLSKIEAGELEIAEESFVVNDVVEALRTTLETAARQKMLGFSVSVSPDMPQQILGDVKRVTQVLLNLTDNAIKFTDEGEVSVLIEPVNGTQWRMAVRDTGRGIREEDAQVIFDEFRQADSAAGDTKAQGAGLGLAITRHLVKIMEGEIRLQSEIGKGSTFEVILPLKAAEVA